MKRREFLTLGTTAALTGATAPRRAHAADRVDPSAIPLKLEEFDRVVEATRAWFAPSEEWAPDRALAELSGQLWMSLAGYAAFLELPLALQVHPAFQKRIRAAMEGFGRAATELNRIFAADDPELWARLEEGYQRLPETKEALRAGEREARKVGVNAVGRRRLMTMLRQALEQVQTHGVRATVQSVGDLAATPAPPLPSTDTRLNAEVAAHRESWREAEEEEVEDAPASGSQPLHPAASVGLVALGLLVVPLGAAIIYVGVGLLASIPFCFCIGAFVLLVGVIVLVGGLGLIVRAFLPATPPPKASETPRVTEN